MKLSLILPVMRLTSVRLIVGALLWAFVNQAIAAGEHDHGHHDEAEERGHTKVPEHFAQEAGVETQTAGPRTVRLIERLYGHIRENKERRVNVRAPYGGEVIELNLSVGDSVKKGAVLARIRSLESLEVYPLRSPINGTVIHRHKNPGELAQDSSILTLVDLNSVWLEMAAYPEQVARLAPEQTVKVQGLNQQFSATTRIDYVAPHRLFQNQSTVVRATLDNENRHWAPGMMVTGEVTVEEREVPVAVRRSALQTLDGRTVVFIRKQDDYEAQAVDLGAGNRDYVEVVQGLEAGVEYVTENSFLIKADILKSGASHSH